MEKKFYFFMVCTVLLLSSCGLPVKGFDKSEADIITPNQTEVVEDSELFKEKEKTGESDSLQREFNFKTNDRKYLTSNGYTIWTTPFVQLNNQQIEIEVEKKSGDSKTGYGLVFFRQKIEEKRDYFLTVMINTKGQYCIGKVIDGNFKFIKPWEQESCINSGLGMRNNIKIGIDSITKKVDLIINGTKVYNFEIASKISINNSSYGFVTVISNSENFPQKAVEIKYINKSK